MSGGDTLPRVLVNPKLHRRQVSEVPFSRTNSSTQEIKKHICPPIDALKDTVSSDNTGLSQLSEKSRPCLNLQHDKVLADNAISPLSPADGLSPACTAMANACNHDHDYLSPDNHRLNHDGSRHMSELSLNLDLNDDIIRPRPEMKAIIRIPAPPKPTTQKSPRDGKFARDVSLRHPRRIIKPPTELNDAKNKQKQQESQTTKESNCIFVSTSRTSQPRRVRSRTSRRKIKALSNENSLVSGDQPSSSSSSKRSTSTTHSDSSKTTFFETIENNDNFDVSKDKLTVEWQNMVKQYQSKQEDASYFSDAPSEEEVGQPVQHSTPGRTDLKKDAMMPSPRPSVTPCPPTASRRSARHVENSTNDEITEKDNESVAKNDSAYFSFSSSISSLQPHSSAGTPIARWSAREQSRPSTGQRSAGSTRPSSGKRTADASLSSSSSGSSSEDDSLCSSVSSKILEEDSNQSVNEASNRKTRNSSVDSTKSTTDSSRKEHKPVRLRKGKKVVVKPHIRPIPPRKPKDPLPMNRRALPSSFFQEPNRVSPSPYNILPPVLPLFRQPLNDDMKDIRPVTPPEQQKPPEERHLNYSEHNKRVVIKMGEPDLLHRLFDAVDPQPQGGRRIKRGRPKRPPRILPSPKLTLDNNPCIIQSITEKLFPNLSIEKRQHKQRNFRNQVIAGMMLGSENNLLEDSGLNSSGSLTDIDTHEKDISQFNLFSINSSSYEEETLENRMEISSPTPLAQRQEFLALPQLPLSQMLSDVTANL